MVQTMPSQNTLTGIAIIGGLSLSPCAFAGTYLPQTAVVKGKAKAARISSAVTTTAPGPNQPIPTASDPKNDPPLDAFGHQGFNTAISKRKFLWVPENEFDTAEPPNFIPLHSYTIRGHAVPTRTHVIASSAANAETSPSEGGFHLNANGFGTLNPTPINQTTIPYTRNLPVEIGSRTLLEVSTTIGAQVQTNASSVYIAPTGSSAHSDAEIEIETTDITVP
ncbi:MAG: hypothetical protein EOP14_07900 [Pseudomonas sp.]|nr:MAG: hypothetical protein EOP14_07900 [Pseudomonas sp.]